MKYFELFPLTELLALQCIDDRTTDFTLALIDFADWNIKRQNSFQLSKNIKERENETSQKLEVIKMKEIESETRINIGMNDEEKVKKTASEREMKGINKEVTIDCTKSEDLSVYDTGSKYYVWPDFILNLLRQPSVWASWRKKVERAILSNIKPGKTVRVRVYVYIYIYGLVGVSYCERD